MEKRPSLQQMLLGKVVIKKLKLDPCLSPCSSINSKWIKDLNIRSKTLKLVQERSGNTLEVIGIGKDFLNRTLAAQQLREGIDQWDFVMVRMWGKRNPHTLLVGMQAGATTLEKNLETS
jgi:hypothetical protein